MQSSSSVPINAVIYTKNQQTKWQTNRNKPVLMFKEFQSRLFDSYLISAYSYAFSLFAIVLVIVNKNDWKCFIVNDSLCNCQQENSTDVPAPHFWHKSGSHSRTAVKHGHWDCFVIVNDSLCNCQQENSTDVPAPHVWHKSGSHSRTAVKHGQWDCFVIVNDSLCNCQPENSTDVPAPHVWHKSGSHSRTAVKHGHCFVLHCALQRQPGNRFWPISHTHLLPVKPVLAYKPCPLLPITYFTHTYQQQQHLLALEF